MFFDVFVWDGGGGFFVTVTVGLIILFIWDVLPFTMTLILIFRFIMRIRSGRSVSIIVRRFIRRVGQHDEKIFSKIIEEKDVRMIIEVRSLIFVQNSVNVFSTLFISSNVPSERNALGGHDQALQDVILKNLFFKSEKKFNFFLLFC